MNPDTDIPVSLRNLIRDREVDSVLFARYSDGVAGVVRILNIDPKNGVESSEVSARRQKYGSNAQEPDEMTAYLSFLKEAFSDFTIIMLAIAGLVSLGIAIGYSRDAESYAKGAAILISVLIVTNVTAINEYNKQAQFARLNATVTDVTDRCLRDGVIQDVKAADLVCGDVVQFKVGDIFSADGLLLEGQDVSVDESSLTGEPKLIRKDPIRSPFLLSGTKVMEGDGTYLVIAVGVNSEAGQIRELVRDKKTKPQPPQSGNADTAPSINISENEGSSILTTKLHKIAVAISKFAFILAAIVLIITCVRFSVVTYALTDPTTICAYITGGQCGSQEVNDYSPDPSVGFPNCGLSNTVFPCCSQVFDGAQLLGSPCPWMKNHLNDFLSFIITAITIVVVVIPEGLPLAVTLSLAFSVRKMQNDNNLVKHLDACETMGSATIICSDKTGTLTKNRMTVVQSSIGLTNSPLSSQLPKWVTSDLWSIGIATFGTADIAFNESTNLWDQIGSKTECALLQTLPDIVHSDYKSIRKSTKIVKRFPFNSTVKKSSVIIDLGNKYRLYTIGASEIVLDNCTFVIDVAVENVPAVLSNQVRNQILQIVESYANKAMRTIIVAYKDLPININIDSVSVDEFGLTFIGLVGIEDPLRDEVPDAIAKCNRAGVDVKMVTGDNLNTAIAIAKNAKIIRQSDIDPKTNELKQNVAMTGPEFRSKVVNQQGEIMQEKIDEIWPRLRVLARSSPTDKYTLVSGIMASNCLVRGDRQVVAVTGDGTNDAPALKKADVGFAMGITGTAVARDAADIILLDDNFASIVIACKWGRNVYDSVAKFMQFQLTVMTVAVVIALEGVFIYYESPISAVQMLWVNLIMNALASLSLATEPPTESLLNRPPHGRKQSMISQIMLYNIIGQSIYQLIILNLFFFFGPNWFNITDGTELGPDAPPSIHFTFIFNCLVFMQLTNQINSRKLNHEKNVFMGLFTNKYFLTILAAELILQVIFVQFGGAWLGTAPLPAFLWGYSVAVAAGSFPVQQLIVQVRRLVIESQKKQSKGRLGAVVDKELLQPVRKLEPISPSAGDDAIKSDLPPPIDIIYRKSSSFHFQNHNAQQESIQRDLSSVSLPNGRRIGGRLLSSPPGERSSMDGSGDSSSSKRWTATERKLQRYFSHKRNEQAFLAAAREYRSMRSNQMNMN